MFELIKIILLILALLFGVPLIIAQWVQFKEVMEKGRDENGNLTAEGKRSLIKELPWIIVPNTIIWGYVLFTFATTEPAKWYKFY